LLLRLVLFAAAVCVVYAGVVSFTPLTRYQWLSFSTCMTEADEAKLNADAGVVLGYSLLKNGSVSPVLADRLRKGAQLLRDEKVGWLILSGGRQNQAVQAQVMSEWLQREEGIESGKLVLESWSNNTWQNAVLSMEIVRQRGWKQIVVVTSSFHQLRSSLVFQVLEEREVELLMARPCEIEAITPWHGQWDFIRECGAILKYLLKGHIPFVATVRLLLPLALPYLAVASALIVILLGWVLPPLVSRKPVTRRKQRARYTNKEKQA